MNAPPRHHHTREARLGHCARALPLGHLERPPGSVSDSHAKLCVPPLWRQNFWWQKRSTIPPNPFPTQTPHIYPVPHPRAAQKKKGGAWRGICRLWQRISRHEPGHMAPMCPALGPSGAAPGVFSDCSPGGSTPTHHGVPGAPARQYVHLQGQWVQQGPHGPRGHESCGLV